MTSAAQAALRRHRAIAIGALAVLTLLAWAWIVAGAGMGMAPAGSLAPHVGKDAMPGMNAMPGMDAMPGVAMPHGAPTHGWGSARFALVFFMWWVMMVAMMLPAAAPTVLLYARAALHAPVRARPAIEAFLAGYLIAWAGFSLLASVLQMALERSGALDAMTMAPARRWLPAVALVAAGLYQLSPVKQACLRHCRSPARFLSRHYRPGSAGALRMGLIHGSFCVGCCWLLMGLLFVGGVMNLAWIAILTVLVAGEKLLPFGRAVAIAAGVACIAWGLALGGDAITAS